MADILQKDDAVEIASDAKATRDVLPITITRVQQVDVWKGSLKEIAEQKAFKQSQIDEMLNNIIPSRQQEIADLEALEASLNAEFDKQQPISMESEAAKEADAQADVDGAADAVQ